MSWYKAGTVSVAQNSNAVIGSGTAFIQNGRVGDAFIGPDGELYEVTNIASDTALAISPHYRGATAATGAYALVPIQGYVKETADALRAASNQIGDELTNLETDIQVATDAAGAAGQSRDAAAASASSAAGSASAAADSKSQALGYKNAAQQAVTDAGAQAQTATTQATNANTARQASEAARDSANTYKNNAAASASAAADSASSVANKAGSGANSDITSLSGLTTPLSVQQGGTGTNTGVPVMTGASSSTAGVKGLVPAPPANAATRFLSSLGTWLQLNLAWGAITGTLSAQTDLQAALDAKRKAAIRSPQQSITLSSFINWSHGQAAVPATIDVFLVCTTAEAGFQAGSIVRVPSRYLSPSSAEWGWQVSSSSTTVSVRAPSALVLISLADGTGTVLTAANWRIIIEVTPA